ncbi:GGDEF domain-containing protein [Enterobacter cancerogenus]|uniref:GGDEF domain-containing protein n=1 Tax=Enterobacter cancerogenus TaxID=69218 RepID=UPI00018264CB|nr:GGDEF domain-containing protein [Enterobacter cancerogenus]EFC55414.1 diguanylate cyclase (GGDEF) domain protein [Enterobacter cancerogenus ATCC 35316]
MTPRLQFIISFIIFILSPMCLFIGYKKTDKEMNDTEQKINILIKKNALIEAIGEDFLYSSTPNPNQGGKLRTTYQHYITALKSSALPASIVSPELDKTKAMMLAASRHDIAKMRTYFATDTFAREIQSVNQRSTRRTTWIKLSLLLCLPLLISLVRTVYHYYLTTRFKLLAKDYYRDSLTKVYNRNYLDVALKSHQSSHLLIVDVDDFKRVNDKYGHYTGDVVLAEIARNISHSVRSHDIVIRFGGDEFLVMLHDTTLEEAKKIARRIARPEKKTLMVNREEITLPTVSIGMADFNDSFVNSFNLADKAIYKMKNNGKGGVYHE